MIAVLADDISGAAELAALARARGLSAEVHLTFTPPYPSQTAPPDVIAIDSQSRALPASQAPEHVASLARAVLRSQPGFLYKKIDSVLRGHVLPEIQAMMTATGHRRALLIPANPTRQRIIRNGHYFVNGQPLHQTAFAHDPDFPARTSEVRGLLENPSPDTVCFPSQREPLLPRRIAVPNVESPEDIAWWCSQMDDATLAVGGAEFFSALLETKKLAATAAQAPVQPPGPSESLLFVCGSLHAWESGRRVQCETHGIPVALMPDLGRDDSSCQPAMRSWSAAIRSALGRAPHGRSMAAIGNPPHSPDRNEPSCALTELLARALEPVFREHPVDHVLIEGGATAFAVLHRMGWHRLVVGQPLAPGLAPMVPHGKSAPRIWIKPGSYPWPESLLPRG